MQETLPHIFPEGPSVAVRMAFQESLWRVSLEESPLFSVRFSALFPVPLKEEILFWMESYGKKKNPPPLSSLPGQNLPPFSREVLLNLKKVPFGKTVSYGDLAKESGNAKATRAVGTICRRNPFPLFIPCHRVLPQNGDIGRFAFGPAIKKQLLLFEGAI